MKILMVNKFFYIKGGSETYYFALKKILEDKGHTVIDFSMKDEKNFESDYSDYFVDNIDYNSNQSMVKTAMKVIYSAEAKKKFEAIVKATKPDLVHLHIFQHQLSPSILDVIKKYNIPTLYTAHDLKMVCLNYKMMHHDTICEDCKNGNYFNLLKNRCVKESFLKSSVNFVEGYLHKFRKSYDAIDTIVTPSYFYKEKFAEFGVDPNRVYHIPNFLATEAPRVDDLADKEQYFLYFGRLSEEKGVATLVNAVKGTGIKLKIVGTGPLKDDINELIKRENVTNVEMLGFKSGSELTNIVGNAKAVVVPSEWYENGPYTAIESLQLSRPIIGANIGGIPELVENNGYLFESANVEDLRDKVIKLNSLSDEEYNSMKKASLAKFNKDYTDTVHMNALLKLYDNLLK